MGALPEIQFWHLVDFCRFVDKIKVLELDLASLCSVNKFVEEFQKLRLPLHYLVLNAAVLGVPYNLTHEGFEMHFGVNYLGHLYLTQLLLPLLRKEKTEDVRIVAVCCTSPVKSSSHLSIELKNCFVETDEVEIEVTCRRKETELQCFQSLRSIQVGIEILCRGVSESFI